MRYAFYAPLENAHVCHCRMCQRATGGVFAALAGGAPENFAWTRGTPGFFASSNLAQRALLREMRHAAVVQVRHAQRAHVRHHRLARSSRAACTLVKQFGIESRLPWVKFCEDVPAERTAESAAAQEFLAKMQDNQSPRLRASAPAM